MYIEDNNKKSKIPIHLILGASDYLCVKRDEPSRIGKTGDPVAEKTKFGWTVITKGKEIDYTAMLLTHFPVHFTYIYTVYIIAHMVGMHYRSIPFRKK